MLRGALGEPGRDERAHVGAAHRERQDQEAGDLDEHGPVDDARRVHGQLERAPTFAGRAEARPRRAASPGGPGPSARRSPAEGSPASTTHTRWSVKTGWVRPGNSKPSGPMIRSRRSSCVSNWPGADVDGVEGQRAAGSLLAEVPDERLGQHRHRVLGHAHGEPPGAGRRLEVALVAEQRLGRLDGVGDGGLQLLGER